MKILNFGSCNIDYVYSLDHIVTAGETVPALDMHRFVGGKGLNQSVALANAKANVYHAGCVGNDGKILKDFMLNAGVDLTYLKTADAATGQAIIQVDKSGENSIVIFAGANHLISEEYIDSVLSNFEAGDFLLLQNEINNTDYIINLASQIGMKIFFNPAPFTEDVRSLALEKLYCLIVNETEAAALCQKDGIDGFADFLKATLPKTHAVMTLGKSGSVYIQNGKRTYQNAFSVKAVDTTAAGDTFVGYFIAELSRGKSPEDALNTASKASAISVSRHGAAPSIPTLKEVEASTLTSAGDSKVKTVKSKILDYINTEYRQASLSELAKILGYSEAYTTRLVKKQVGKSFSELLCKKRCDEAAALLKNTDIPIKEIIARTGYSNEGFFRRNFYLLYGQSPAKYRQNFEK